MTKLVLRLCMFCTGMILFASSMAMGDQSNESTWCVALVPQFFERGNPVTVRWDTTFDSGGSWDAAIISGASGVMKSQGGPLSTAYEVCVSMPLWFFDSFTATTLINFYNNDTNQKLGDLTLTTSTHSIFSIDQNLTSSSMGIYVNGWGYQSLCLYMCTVVQFPWPW